MLRQPQRGPATTGAPWADQTFPRDSDGSPTLEVEAAGEVQVHLALYCNAYRPEVCYLQFYTLDLVRVLSDFAISKSYDGIFCEENNCMGFLLLCNKLPQVS